MLMNFYKGRFNNNKIKLNEFNFVYIHIKSTLNNLFLIAYTKSGKLLHYVTCGIVGYKGPARGTFYAVEKVGKSFLEFLVLKGFFFGVIVLKTKMSKKMREVFRGLYGSKSKIVRIILRIKMAHNGVRLKK